jgi:LPS export ABC transporter protein LptC
LKQFGEGIPIKEAFQVKFLFSENAILQAELNAPHAIESKENGQETRLFDKGLHLVFYTPEGVKQSELSAGQGRFKNQFNDAEVWDEVVMINDKGDRLETERLFWNKSLNRIHTNERVKIMTAKELIYGDSLDSNASFTEYKIYSIHGSLDVKEEEM